MKHFQRWQPLFSFSFNRNSPPLHPNCKCKPYSLLSLSHSTCLLVPESFTYIIKQLWSKHRVVCSYLKYLNHREEVHSMYLSMTVIDEQTRLAFWQYTCSQYVHRGENHLKQNHSRKACHYLVYICMQYERFKLAITTPLRQWKHTQKHYALFGDDNGQYLV